MEGYHLWSSYGSCSSPGLELVDILLMVSLRRSSQQSSQSWEALNMLRQALCHDQDTYVLVDHLHWVVSVSEAYVVSLHTLTYTLG